MDKEFRIGTPIPLQHTLLRKFFVFCVSLGFLFSSSEAHPKVGICGQLLAANQSLYIDVVADSGETKEEHDGSLGDAAKFIEPSSRGELKAKQLYKVNDGPWGPLEYFVTYLQVPDHFADLMEMPERTVWYFREPQPEAVIRNMASAGITHVNAKEWFSMGEFCRVEGFHGIAFLPNEELVLRLRPIQRTALHQLLSRQEKNLFSANPIVIESGDPHLWFKEAGLDEATAGLAASLCYPNQKATVFSDPSYVLSQIESPEIRREFVRITTRTRTLILRLNVNDLSRNDFDGIVFYWTNGHKRKAILPLLESVYETPGVERLDIAHLLPPTPRKLIYTYPGIDDFLNGGGRDCHWTALNFYRANPNEVLPRSIDAEIFTEQYAPVSGELTFGDILQFVEQGHNYIDVRHSAIYIAGDIVFTKNGSAQSNPWILMRYGDLVSRYFSDKWLVRAIRLKGAKE